jgi:hypothetical protein
MGRAIGTILGAILGIWLVVMVAGGIFATLKTFVIIGLIAMTVFIRGVARGQAPQRRLARRSRRGRPVRPLWRADRAGSRRGDTG